LKTLSKKIPVSGLPPAALEQIFTPLPAFRVRQIFRWVHAGIDSFDKMTNLPQSLRGELDGRFTLRSTKVKTCIEDPDGSLKLQIELEDGLRIETVVLRDGADRRTVCLSTQAGCAMGCVFCKTGALGFARNLLPHEIAEQFFHGRESAGDISNIVFMGMGEPLLNLDALRESIAALTGSDFSQRRITVSTCGIVKGIIELAENGPAVRLAVSLPTAREALRRRLMPGAAGAACGGSLAELKDALLRYKNKTGKRVTLEAVLLGGVNTGPQDAKALTAFSKDLNVLINLIPWNPVEGVSFEGLALRSPSKREVENFAAALEKAGLKTVIRRGKGRAAAGACGQLGLNESTN
jgi:23S rRNA (adenine2503-C2)-methyltransferase